MMTTHTNDTWPDEDESDLLEIMALICKYFEDQDKAVRWLNRPCYGLSGKRPIEVMVDERGRQEVAHVINSKIHGFCA